MLEFLNIFEIFGLYHTNSYLSLHNYYMTLQFKKKTMHNFNHIVPNVVLFFTALREILIQGLQEKRKITFYILTLRKQYFIEINNTFLTMDQDLSFFKINPVSFSKQHVNYLNLDFILILGDILPEDSIYLNTFKEQNIPLFGICSYASDASIYTYFFVFEKSFKNIYLLMLFCLQYIKTITYYLLLQERSTYKSKYQVSTSYAYKQFKLLLTFHKALFVEQLNNEVQKKVLKNKKSKKNQKLWLRTIKLMKISYLIARHLRNTKKLKISKHTRSSLKIFLDKNKKNYLNLRSLLYKKILNKKQKPKIKKLTFFAKRSKRKYSMFLFGKIIKRAPHLIVKKKKKVKRSYMRTLHIKGLIRNNIRQRFLLLRKKKKEKKKNLVLKIQKIQMQVKKKGLLKEYLKNKYEFKRRLTRRSYNNSKFSFYNKVKNFKKEYKRRNRKFPKYFKYQEKVERYNTQHNRTRNRPVKPFYDKQKENPISHYYKNKHERFFLSSEITPQGFERLKFLMQHGLSKGQSVSAAIKKLKFQPIRKRKVSFIIRQQNYKYFRNVRKIKFSKKAKRAFFLVPKNYVLKQRFKKKLYAQQPIVTYIIKKNLKKKLQRVLIKKIQQNSFSSNSNSRGKKLFVRIVLKREVKKKRKISRLHTKKSKKIRVISRKKQKPTPPSKVKVALKKSYKVKKKNTR